MATVTDNTYIFTDAKSDNFANVTFNDYQKNIVTKVFFSDMKTGFRWDDNTLTIDPFHVVRLFGGNNLATMDIQPTWNLKRGKIENVYFGGNMGDMTYYNPDGKPATTDGMIGSQTGVGFNADGSNSNYMTRGLSITIDQPDIYINSLFGGCRMSDVLPTPKAGQEAWPEGTNGEDFYGATVNITDGYIENVYGGNDVSGTVHHGTNVNISGAVSGNVYGSGNGFYLYKYDEMAKEVTEDINDEYGIFYRVPERDANGKLYDERGVEDTDTHRLLTINAARPSVEKAFLNIAGLEHYPAGEGNPKRVAYVKGNVFCGGNASTIIDDGSFSKFKIGSYVTLNGVFMGSDGKSFTDNDQIAAFARINGFADMGAVTEFNVGYEEDKAHNPILLNTYMMAVDMKAQPKTSTSNSPSARPTSVPTAAAVTAVRCLSTRLSSCLSTKILLYMIRLWRPASTPMYATTRTAPLSSRTVATHATFPTRAPTATRRCASTSLRSSCPSSWTSPTTRTRRHLMTMAKTSKRPRHTTSSTATRRRA